MENSSLTLLGTWMGGREKLILMLNICILKYILEKMKTSEIGSLGFKTMN